MTEHDAGDEHRDPPPREPSMIEKLIEKLDAVIAELGIRVIPETLFWNIVRAEGMRACCRACRDEARGVEDGS